MQLRSKLLGLAAAAAICLGVAAPAAATGPSGTTGTGLTVSFSEGGSFSVSLGVLEGFSGGAITASTGEQTLGAKVQITYTDTQSYRDPFRVDMSATDFESGLQVPYEAPGVTYKIKKDNLKLIHNYNPIQDRWTSEGCSPNGPWPTSPTCVNKYRVADIGATTQTGGSINPAPFSTWTASNSFVNPLYVAYSLAGSGTVHTTQDLDLSLTVPSGMPAANYSSTLTITLTGQTP